MALEPNFLISWVFLCIAATISSTLFFFRKKPHRFSTKKLQKKKKNLPPGELGLPWIGETMKFYKAQKTNRLFEDFVNPRIIKHGNIFKTKIMGSPTIVVNGAEANRLILSNEFNLVKSSWPSSSVQLMGMNCIMAKQGERHRVLRGIIANSLGYNGLESLVPKLCDAVRFHLETEWRGKEEISLYRSTKSLTFTVVFECLYGIKVELGMLEMFERVLDGVFALPVQFPCSRFGRAKNIRVYRFGLVLVNIGLYIILGLVDRTIVYKLYYLVHSILMKIKTISEMVSEQFYPQSSFNSSANL